MDIFRFLLPLRELLSFPTWVERSLAAYFILTGLWALWVGARIPTNVSNRSLRRFLMFYIAVVVFITAVCLLLQMELYALIVWATVLVVVPAIAAILIIKRYLVRTEQ